MTTEAEAISALAAKAAEAHIVNTDDGRAFLIPPIGGQYVEVSDPHGLKTSTPRYIAQAVTLQTVDSLVDYVNRFKGDDSMLFADIMANSISALVDYHSPNKAANVAHRATMTLPFSEEWKLWTAVSGRLQGQLDFARFIEENAADVRTPDAGELLDACRDLQIRRKVNFIKAVRTASDNENFEYSEETAATTKKGDLELPTKFLLGLPVYFGEQATEVYAFLRWRLDDGALTLGIQLHRVEHVRQAVFRQIVLDVSERTKCPVVFGKAS
jgi:uncharacterized protein YfdQ (DUF2303 family)